MGNHFAQSMKTARRCAEFTQEKKNFRIADINDKIRYMISQLKIRNFGIIDDISLEFCSGLNIFTGETGAGKSIIMDALRFCLGERLDSSQIRDSDKPCIVEAMFEFRKGEGTSPLRNPIFSEYISDNEGEETSPLLIINRVYLPDGRNRIKINGFNVTVTQLKEIGNHLVDFHGQHDHQMLFSEESHIEILDRLSDLNTEKNEYEEKYNAYLQLQKDLNELHSFSANRERESDMLNYQIKELEQVSLEEDAYQNILQEHSRIANSEKLYEFAKQLIDILENEESGLNRTISRSFTPMRSLNNLDDSTVKFAEILSRIQNDSSELLQVLNKYLEEISFDPDKTREINSYYDIYYEITRKYGPTLEDVRKFYNTAKKKYELLSNLEHNDVKLREKIELSERELEQIAKKLTQKRKKSAGILKTTIEKELKELGILNVLFECRMEKVELNRDGMDRVVFYISPNIGEELKPLSKIASGGESARVMLALKKALTKVDPIPVLIFDEIDAQIGGRLGDITGKKLKELSDNRQVILITHLPQIAAFSDQHFKVTKKVKDNRTIINVDLLDKTARVEELAKMMSGEKESPIALKHAKEMLNHVEGV
ncbi:MAG: DNA repair protein RecN [bacterium]